MRTACKPQRVYINGRFLDQPLSGVQRYAREILAAMDRQLAGADSRGERWCLLTTGRESDLPSLANMDVRPVQSRWNGHLWEQVALAGAAKDGCLVGFGGSGPVAHPRQLVIIHDASVYRNPHFYSRLYGTVHRSLGRVLSRRAKIGTVSRFSQGELGDVLGLQPASIPVFHNGSDHMRRTPPSDAEFRKLGLEGTPYFVILGSLTRNKNLSAAIQALSHVPDARLIVIGSVNARIFGGAGQGVETDRVHFAGRLEDAEVAGLLRHAAGLVFPSLYEGFGIPPLEAMVNRCPVIASDIGSVREVCADAALYFDPADPLALAAAMRTLLTETENDRQLRLTKGSERANRFTWEGSARSLIDFCREHLIRQA